MADLTAVISSAPFRQIVQDNLLQQQFHDALYPAIMFASEATPEKWEANTGDVKLFTGKGLIPPKVNRMAAGVDPVPTRYGLEQWQATCGRWLDTIDTDMPTAILACVNKLMEDIKQMGLAAGRSKDILCRNALYNAGLSGHTVVTTGAASATQRVKRLNGFTRVRRADLSGGSQVRYEAVSATNPLQVYFVLAGVPTLRLVTGFTPDFANDELGPGTLTLSASVTTTTRDAVYAASATHITRSGGGYSTEAVTAADILKLSDIRNAVARMRNMSVPTHGDGYYHAHMDATSEGQLFSDNEIQRLNISLPNGLMYQEMAIGKIHGTIVYSNAACPRIDNVGITGGQTSGSDDGFDPEVDPFTGELYNTGDPGTAVAKIHRVVITGREALQEYWVDCEDLISSVGINGSFESGVRVLNDGVNIMADRVYILIRRPIDRAGEKVATTWKFMGDHVVRTDGATGDGAKFKRIGVIEHAEAMS